MRKIISPLFCSLALLSMPLAAQADEAAIEGGAIQVTAGQAIGQAVDRDADIAVDSRADAILEALSDLARFSGDQLATEIANLMVGFTAITEEEAFLAVIDQWRSAMADVIDPAVDPEAMMAVVQTSTWFSSGVAAMPVHVYLDIGCDSCRDTFTVLRGLAEEGHVDLRVTVLPLLTDETFPFAIGLLSDPDTAWDRLTAYFDGTLSVDDIAVDPAPENEAIQAVIEADYDAFVATDVRSLPFTAYRLPDGSPQFVLGALTDDEARALILRD